MSLLTLISDLLSRTIMSRVNLLYWLRYESQIWWVNASGDGGVPCTIYGYFDLGLDLVYSTDLVPAVSRPWWHFAPWYHVLGDTLFPVIVSYCSLSCPREVSPINILFVWFDSLRPINNLSVIQCSDAGEARTCGPLVSRKHSTIEPLRSPQQHDLCKVSMNGIQIQYILIM